MSFLNFAGSQNLTHVQDLRMRCATTTIGTCNAVKTETIGGGAVENEPSLYS